MHFSIPDTQDLCDDAGNPFTAFNIHVNGVFHCAVRYKQLHNFNEQLRKAFTDVTLPAFPPKRLLSLNTLQLEERRFLLERYIQIISQEPMISNSEIFNGFLLSAQQETQQAEPKQATINVYLMNGHKITCNINSTDQTDSVLEAVASKIELHSDFVYYFGLFLVKKEQGADTSIVRKLQDFESPFISLKAAEKDGELHRIVLRKSLWDPSSEDDLIDDRIAMNLLYVQAVSDIEQGWVLASREQHKQLTVLQNRGSKREYLRLARTLKFYGFLRFKSCYTDYPLPDCRVVVYAGNRELIFRVQTANDQIKEGLFKVTRMRCWRITTTYSDVNGGKSSNHTGQGQLELAFEYLISKDKLQWIKIISDEAILMSMCLQGMVDELLMKKQGKRIKRPQDRSKKTATNFLKRDGTSNMLGSELQRRFLRKRPHHVRVVCSTNGDNEEGNTAQRARESVKRIQDKISSVAIATKPSGLLRAPSHNDAFEGAIGDDDL